MRIDIFGKDIMGVDILGIDIPAPTPRDPYHSSGRKSRITTLTRLHILFALLLLNVT